MLLTFAKRNTGKIQKLMTDYLQGLDRNEQKGQRMGSGTSLRILLWRVLYTLKNNIKINHDGKNPEMGTNKKLYFE